MSTVEERLIESWLDSQNERTYQPAFVQLLLFEGWKILHSTRHSPIELGKDVIARCPKGSLYCFQLKGNPGTRLTKNGARDLLPQIGELVELPLSRSYLKKRSEKFIAVIVTNGFVDEEAQLLLDQKSESVRMNSWPASDLLIWSRGDLLGRFVSAGKRIWPTEISGFRDILVLLSANPRGQPDIHLITKCLVPLSESISADSSRKKKREAITCILLLSEILKWIYYEENNHFALVKITVLAIMNVLRFMDNRDKRNEKVLNIYCECLTEHLRDMLAEAKDIGFDPNTIWCPSDGDPLAEVDIMRERLRILAFCSAALVLQDQGDFENHSFAHEIIESCMRHTSVWGLGAIPGLVNVYWAGSLNCATRRCDEFITEVLRRIVVSNKSRKISRDNSLAPPYYSFEDVIFEFRNLQNRSNSSIKEDDFDGRAWYARPLLFMLAKRNYKQTCKSLWSDFSRITHEEAGIERENYFSALYQNSGRMKNISYFSYHWNELLRDAIKSGEDCYLKGKENYAWIISLYCAIVPYRMLAEVMLWLDGHFARTWYDKNNVRY